MHLELNKKVIGYRCVRCRKKFPVEPFRYQCDACRNNLDVVYDYAWIRSNWSRRELTTNTDQSIWRYLPLLPVEHAPENHSLQTGGTSLVRMGDAKSEADDVNLCIKDDTRNPSGSLKDRATEVGIQHAIEQGKRTVVAASTGNAAASLAALAAFYKMRAVILVPVSSPKAKLTQILQYGAVLCPVEGNYDQAFELSLQIVETYGWYSRSSGFNPTLSEGKKTVALEIAEQLGWATPDKIYVPVGDGCIIGGVYKGWFDLVQLGWVDTLPQIIAVQADGSAAIVNALESGNDIAMVKAKTVADGISVNYPRDGLKALRAVRKSGGHGVIVTDDEILEAQKRMSETAGIFAEPAGAAAFAGFLKDRSLGKIKSGERIVLLATGSGLKDIPAAQKRIRIPAAIDPTIEAFRQFTQNIDHPVS